MTSILRGLDFYKLTLGQFIFERHPDVHVVLKLHNRSSDKLIDYVLLARLRDRLEQIRGQGFTSEDIEILSSFKTETGAQRFTKAYLEFLLMTELPPVYVSVEHGDLFITVAGPWPTATLWETIIMAEVNEHYYRNKATHQTFGEGKHRLEGKIETLSRFPGVNFADFGTRRRYAYAWQWYVVRKLAKECPNFIGTSNVWLAYELGVKPIGTFPHEPVMVYGALADLNGGSPLEAQNLFLRDWYIRYGHELSIALTDTFTTESFLKNFGAFNAARYRGVRHDSGDPYLFADRMIGFYNHAGIDPRTKTIVFSDGLTLGSIVNLYEYFKGRINMTFGWGTSLTNDIGPRANNFVVKVVEANGMPTVKLSDVDTKHTGPPEKIRRYKALL